LSVIQKNGDGWPTNLEKRGWLGAAINREDITHRLSSPELDCIRQLVERSKRVAKPLCALTREAFSDLRLDALISSLVRKLKQGPGIIVISGIPVQTYTLDELRILFCGIGNHFGVPVSQNVDGELMGEVRVRPNKIALRAYSKPGALNLHSDRIDILALFSIQAALTGGATLFKSGLEIWDTVAREHPEYLPVLRRGFYQHRGGEQPDGEPPITNHRVPIFGVKDGIRSCLFSANAMPALQMTLVPGSLTTEEVAALQFVDEVKNRPEFNFPLLLEPGEIVFINNYEILHGRDHFEDGDTPETQRFLLRLWLQGRPWRPKPDDMMVVKNKSGLQGIDPKPDLKAYEVA
jgi:hypothetical protein